MTAEHAGQAGAHAFVAIRREHLAGVIELFREERWPAFADDPEATWRAMTAPGVTTMVAVDGERVVGVAQMLSDGQIQAHLSVIVVAEGYRRRGIGRRGARRLQDQTPQIPDHRQDQRKDACEDEGSGL